MAGINNDGSFREAGKSLKLTVSTVNTIYNAMKKVVLQYEYLENTVSYR